MENSSLTETIPSTYSHGGIHFSAYQVPCPPQIPIPEPVDGGDELNYTDFHITYVSNADPGWPQEKFGDINAPWNRSRWNDPWYLLQPEPVLASFSAVVGSPVNLLVVGPEGRRVGYDPETESVVSEIPRAAYLIRIEKIKRANKNFRRSSSYSLPR